MEKYTKVITGHFIFKKNSLKIKIVQKTSLHYLLVCTNQNAVVILDIPPLWTDLAKMFSVECNGPFILQPLF